MKKINISGVEKTHNEWIEEVKNIGWGKFRETYNIKNMGELLQVLRKVTVETHK